MGALYIPTGIIAMTGKSVTQGPPAPRPPVAGKLFIKTQGCQMNVYDSAKMADVLAAAHGLELTDQESQADVILINT